VVSPEDPAQLADAIRMLMADPSRRAEMGTRGRAYVERHSDRTALARHYRQILDAKGNRA
jgi:glycosyltransferase involved in cell wall biosynthesis